MKTLSYSDARQNFASVMNETIEDRAPVLITRQKGTPCVLMSLAEYEALEETAYLLRSPANARHLMDSIAQLKAGKGIERDLTE